MALTVLDAGVLIGFLDSNDAHHDKATGALQDAFDRGDRLVLPASAYAAALVGPSRRGAEAVATVHTVLERVPIDVEPLGQDVAVRAAALRAGHLTLKLRDALVIATADALDADRLITTDRRWPARGTLGLRATITTL
jgi:predicted nucleic acid-binding protein